jgi:hypothetical protein
MSPRRYPSELLPLWLDWGSTPVVLRRCRGRMCLNVARFYKLAVDGIAVINDNRRFGFWHVEPRRCKSEMERLSSPQAALQALNYLGMDRQCSRTCSGFPLRKRTYELTCTDLGYWHITMANSFHHGVALMNKLDACQTAES